MRIMQIECFTYNELNEDAKQRARDEYREKHAFSDDAEFVLSEWQEKLSLAGWQDPTIYYSGFWSQGDGACFVCEWVDLEKVAHAMLDSGQHTDDEAILIHRLIDFAAFDDFGADVRSVGRYCHENSATLNVSGYSGRGMVDKAVDTFAEMADEYRRDVCQAIYSDLEKEYEYRTSDGYLDEWLAESDDEYDQFGNSI